MIIGSAAAHMLGANIIESTLGILYTGGLNYEVNVRTTTGWHQPTITAPTSGSTQVAYGNNMYVIIGQAASIATRILDSSFPSPVMTGHNIDPIYSFPTVSVTYGAGLFVIGGGGGTTAEIKYSTDGAIWSGTTITSYPYPTGTRCFFDNGYFYLASGQGSGFTNGRCYRSTDAITWSQMTLPYAATSYDISAVNNIVFIRPNSSTTDVFISTDQGVNWSTVTSNQPNIVPNFYANGVYMDGQVLGAGPTVTYYTSTNGYTWTSRSSSLDLRAFTTKNNTFKCINKDGDKIYSSNDGVTWAQVGTATAAGFTPVAMTYGA